MAILPEQRPEEEEQSGQNSLANTLGLIIFLLAIGSQFIQPLFGWLGQFIGAGTANRLGSTIPNLFPLLIIGLVLLTVVISVVSSIAAGVGRMRRDSDTPTPSLPPSPYPSTSGSYPSAANRGTTRSTTQQSYQPGVPTAPNMDTIFPHGQSKSSSSAYNLPRAPLPSNPRLHQQSSMLKNGQVRTPDFEPILDATVLTYGILAILISGALIGGVAALAGFLP